MLFIIIILEKRTLKVRVRYGKLFYSSQKCSVEKSHYELPLNVKRTWNVWFWFKFHPNFNAISVLKVPVVRSFRKQHTNILICIGYFNSKCTHEISKMEWLLTFTFSHPKDGLNKKNCLAPNISFYLKKCQ